ncbi:MAG: hypothetical protein ACLFQX_04945 [Candidatus Kapaibacterium sp.]
MDRIIISPENPRPCERSSSGKHLIVTARSASDEAVPPRHSRVTARSVSDEAVSPRRARPCERDEAVSLRI